MMKQRKITKVLSQAGQAAVTAALCAVLVAPTMLIAPTAMLAEEPAKTVLPLISGRTAALTQQEKVLHALNRLTFGPRPGDEAAVSKMGLEAWFQMQLHPERIDDSAFEREMDMFPAMRLSSEQLMQRFPSPQMLRAMEKKDGELPSDVTERAIYADAEAAYARKLKQDAAGAPAVSANGGDSSMQSGAAADMQAPDSMAPDSVAPNSTAPDNVDAKNKKGKAKVARMDQNSADAVLALPPDQRMQQLLAMSPQESASFRAALRGDEQYRLMQGMSPQQMEIVAAMQSPVRVVGAEALESRLVRDVSSDRQLQAVMADFWLNHFSVYARKNQNEPYYLPQYQRDVVLPNSMGKFEDLLVATAKSPAMLMYLDNWESVGPDSPAAQRIGQAQKMNPNGKIVQKLPKGINENYARELMELHTLGVGGGYTQKDVIEVAKCFTGWTIDRPYQGMGAGGGGARKGGFLRQGMQQQDNGKPGEFVFEQNRHEPGSKTVLGHVIAEGGINEGLQVLHILATSPATAHFVSTKLAVRFVSDTPSSALVDAMSATFVKTGGDMKAVLTTMFHSPEFWSPQVFRAKVKTPIEFLASALRASDAAVKNPLPLVQAMDRLGMPIYGMQTPNGYSWKADEWVSSNALISRMNFALVLSGGRMPGTSTNWPVLLGNATDSSVATSPTPATEMQLEALLLGQPASERTRATVLAQFNDPMAQKTAEQNFNAQPATEMMAADGTAGKRAAGDAMAEDAAAGDASQAYGMPGKGKGAGLKRMSAKSGRDPQQFSQPGTPLDTMAGLLLGSPDFQRR